MHIILAILGALATVGIIIWRVRMAMDAAREISDLAGEAANLPRKMRFRSKARKRGADVIDDPREAASVLLYGAAACAGPVSREDQAALAGDLAALFETDAGTADELAARAVWHVGVMNDPLNAVNPMTDLVVRLAGQDAVSSLVPVLDAVIARTGAAPSRDQTIYRDKMLRRAGLT